jgi:hypothetical protein
MSVATNNTSFTDNSSSDQQFFQDWYSENNTLIFYNTNTGITPAPLTIPITIKDVIGTPAGDYYPYKRVYVEKVFILTNQNDWLQCEIDSQILNLSDTFTYSNGLVKNLVLTPQNLIPLSPGVYNLKVTFNIQGKRNPIFSSWNLISFYEHFVQLYVSNQGLITWTPSFINLFHIQNTPFPYKDINMTGNNWKVKTPPNYILSSPNGDVNILAVTSPFFGTRHEASGSGSKVVRFTLSPFFDLPLALTLNPFNENLTMYQNDVYQGSIPFGLYIQENIGFVVLPNQLNFNAFIGIQEATPLEVDVYTSFSYTFIKPAWLVMEVLAESSPGIPSKFLVYPISSQNLGVGNYQDFIIFTYDDGGLPAIEQIDVFHDVYDFAVTPYSSSDINFTKDVKFIEFFSQLNDVYFEMVITAKVYDYTYQSNLSKVIEVPFKIPLFQNKQKQNIGLLIEKMLFSLNEVNPYINTQYKAAEVIVTINEKSYIDNSVISSLITNSYKFLSGLTPKNIVQNCAILDINILPKRVTAQSFSFVNMMLTPSVKNITIKTNGLIVDQYSISSQVDTYRETIYFSNYQIKKGDKVEYVVELDNNLFISKSFIVFPDGDYSTMILFEDEARMVQSFEFTGKYSLKDEFESISQILYQNLVEVLKKYDYTKDVPFSINTGFISSSDKRTIQSICESKRAWIYISDDEMIEIIPITKSLPVMDVDTELISYDLEFQINRKYNEESYSF